MIASLILEAAGTAGLMSTAAGGGSSGGGAKSPITPTENKKMIKSIIEGPKKEREFFKEMLKSVAGKAGINFSVSSMLRQSQVFTTMFGSLFQIIGAFIDIALAPLVPMMTDGLRWLVDQMPAFREKIQDWVDNKWPAIRIWFEENWRNFGELSWWTDKLVDGFTRLKDWFINDVWNGEGDLSGIWTKITEWFNTEVWDKITDWYEGSDLETAVNGIWAVLKLINTVFQGISALNSFIEGQVSDIVSVFERAIGWLQKTPPKGHYETPYLGGGGPAAYLFPKQGGGALNWETQAELDALPQNTSGFSDDELWGDARTKMLLGGYFSHRGNNMRDIDTRQAEASNLTEAQNNANDLAAIQVVHGWH